jgi:probable addiction module antidote protein
MAGTNPLRVPIFALRSADGETIRSARMRRNENYRDDLLADLRNDAAYAAAYLSAAKADSKEAFLVALRDVAEAQSGMKAVAKAADVNRENLYRALSKEGNPRIDTLDSVLEVLGVEMIFVPRGNGRRRLSKTRSARKAGGNS